MEKFGKSDDKKWNTNRQKLWTTCGERLGKRRRIFTVYRRPDRDHRGFYTAFCERFNFFFSFLSISRIHKFIIHRKPWNFRASGNFFFFRRVLTSARWKQMEKKKTNEHGQYRYFVLYFISVSKISAWTYPEDARETHFFFFIFSTTYPALNASRHRIRDTGGSIVIGIFTFSKFLIFFFFHYYVIHLHYGNWLQYVLNYCAGIARVHRWNYGSMYVRIGNR